MNRTIIFSLLLLIHAFVAEESPLDSSNGLSLGNKSSNSSKTGQKKNYKFLGGALQVAAGIALGKGLRLARLFVTSLVREIESNIWKH
ncbi:hypothetical protein OESDEN_13550 [Oesophagostomum dentatum]|uniref:Uncharacterized protein n=1 Tax=Oesophagostomum dentatum TaxID=61180 RepID=A0A0B1SS50_OESDE|nr:hypothetical protein OESDEN_13550 [Oesophagostomum dentatum]